MWIIEECVEQFIHRSVAKEFQKEEVKCCREAGGWEVRMDPEVSAHSRKRLFHYEAAVVGVGGGANEIS